MSRLAIKLIAGICAGMTLLALLAPMSGSASAQAGKPLNAKKLDLIRERMEKGQALFVAGDAAGAAKVFEAAYAEEPYAAFLYNAGVCYQKLGDGDHALEKFRAYLVADPNAPDAARVRARIAALEAARGTPAPATDAEAPEDAGDGGVPEAAPPLPLPSGEDAESMKSLAIIETDPAGAPVKLYARTQANAPPFKLGQPNAGWSEVVSTQSPANLTLEVGAYHVVVEPFRDYRACEADVDVRRAKVFHFRADLSQGDFMSFLRVAGNVQGAYVFVDDEQKKKAPWGTTPHGELVSSGVHSLLVEAPGFEPYHKKFTLAHGEQHDVEVQLVRVGYGILRIDGNAPELEVSIDKNAVGVWRSGEVPLETKLDAGQHQLTIKSSGYKTYEELVKVPRGQVQPLHARMVKKYPRGAAWTQAIIGGVFIGAGVYLGIRSNQDYDALKQDRQAGVLQEDDSRISRGRLFAIGADAGFAVGGVLAAFATYNFLKDPLPPSGAKLDKPVEFDDPRKVRPTAHLRPRTRVAWPRRRTAPAVHLGFSPSVNGFSFGGSF